MKSNCNSQMTKSKRISIDRTEKETVNIEFTKDYIDVMKKAGLKKSDLKNPEIL